MNRRFRSLAVACGLWPVASLIAITTASAQGGSTDRDFRWDGPLASTRWVYVRNLNGSVKVERATGARRDQGRAR